MNNKIYFILSLFILLVASFQLLNAQENKKIKAVEYVDRFPPNQCIATVRKNGRVLLYCGEWLIFRCMGCNKYSGFKENKIKSILKILRRKGYRCGPGTIYEYKENINKEFADSFEEREFLERNYLEGQWYINPVDAKNLDEKFDPNSETPLKIPHLCER